MPFSSGFSPQMKMLSPQQQQDILNDYTQNPNLAGGPPTLNMLKGSIPIAGPVFEGDEVPSTVGPLTRSQVQQIVPVPEEQGALSKVAPPAPQPVDIAEMLKQYMPQDDSQQKYLALAAGFAQPTKTGTLVEQIGNVATIMHQQRAEQDKMRAQYVPLIMQQVAAQQAREEQARYRLEAQQQAQAAQAQAAQAAQQARADAATQAQQAHAAQVGIQQQGLNERSAADRALREQFAQQRADMNIPKTKPGEQWDPITQTIKVIPGSELDRVQKGAHGKDYGTAVSTVTSMDTSIDKLSEILSDKNKDAFNSNFGGYNAQATQYAPGAATDMRKKLEGLKSDLRKAGLDSIRAGGSIGAMTEKEWPIVENMIARIDPTLSEETAREELKKVAAYMERIRNNAVDIYDTEWKNSPHYKPLKSAITPIDVSAPPSTDALRAALAKRNGAQ